MTTRLVINSFCSNELYWVISFAGTFQTERIESEYQNEKLAAVREFEDRKIELKENLIQELEDKKKFIELERQNMDLASDFMEPKPIMTRKLRRRPNEPIPMPGNQKGRRPSPQGGLNMSLDDCDINEDLRMIARSSASKTSNKRDSKK